MARFWLIIEAAIDDQRIFHGLLGSNPPALKDATKPSKEG